MGECHAGENGICHVFDQLQIAFSKNEKLSDIHNHLRQKLIFAALHSSHAT